MSEQRKSTIAREKNGAKLLQLLIAVVECRKKERM
jgi:hypothetical protein